MTRRTGYLWVKRIVATAGVIVSVGAAVATGSMLIHGHPAYVVLIAATLIISMTVAVRSWLIPAPRTRVRRRRRAVQVALIVASALVIAAVA